MSVCFKCGFGGGLLAAVLFASSFAFGGEPLPTPVSGVVTLSSGTTYTVTESTSLAGITQISVVEGSTLEYDIAENQTLEVACQVKGKGMLVKNGPGMVKYTCPDWNSGKAHYIEYPGYVTINNGTLQGPAYGTAASSPNKWNTWYVGRVVVNSPGVFDIASFVQTGIYGLWGDGTVTCSRDGSYNQLIIMTDKGKDSETYHAPSQFSGLISGYIRQSPQGYFDTRARISSATAPIFALARDGRLSGLELGG